MDKTSYKITESSLGSK